MNDFMILGFLNGFFNLLGINFIPNDKAKKVLDTPSEEKFKNDLKKINADLNKTYLRQKQMLSNIVS